MGQVWVRASVATWERTNLPTVSTEQTDNFYGELVRSLYLNITPAAIMWLAFAATFGLVYPEDGDVVPIALGWASLLASAIRLIMTQTLRNQALTAALDRRKETGRESCRERGGTYV